jgi:hypothetical protein
LHVNKSNRSLTLREVPTLVARFCFLLRITDRMGAHKTTPSAIVEIFRLWRIPSPVRLKKMSPSHIWDYQTDKTSFELVFTQTQSNSGLIFREMAYTPGLLIWQRILNNDWQILNKIFWIDFSTNLFNSSNVPRYIISFSSS